MFPYDGLDIRQSWMVCYDKGCSVIDDIGSRSTVTWYGLSSLGCVRSLDCLLDVNFCMVPSVD